MNSPDEILVILGNVSANGRSLKERKKRGAVSGFSLGIIRNNVGLDLVQKDPHGSSFMSRFSHLSLL